LLINLAPISPLDQLPVIPVEPGIFSNVRKSAVSARKRSNEIKSLPGNSRRLPNGNFIPPNRELDPTNRELERMPSAPDLLERSSTKRAPEKRNSVLDNRKKQIRLLHKFVFSVAIDGRRRRRQARSGRDQSSASVNVLR